MNPKASMSMSISSADSFNQRASQKRLMHSDSSVSYQVNIPNNLREEIISRVAYTKEEIESSTSRSFVQGLILVSIMVASLIAFISCKVRPCSSTYIEDSNYEDCLKYFHFYSIMTISSCLVTFLIYFLHLIAQCDILCLRRKKYEFEIITIVVICCLFMFSSISYLARTNIFADSFTLASLILSAISISLYLLRIMVLTFEMISQKRKVDRTNSQSIFARLPQQRSTKDQNVLLPTESAFPTSKVISYVRSTQRTKTLSTSVSDDLEDDVFIQ